MGSGQDRSSSETAVSSYADIAGAADAPRELSAAGLVLLAVVLLVGFGAPLVEVGSGGSVKLSVPNIQHLGKAGPTWHGQLTLVYPFLAGVAVLCLALAARGAWRSMGLLVLGLAGLALLIKDANLERVLPVASGPVHKKLVVLGALAFIGLYTGSRARDRDPGNVFAGVLGAAGALLYLALLLLPLLPQSAGRLPLVPPFRLVGQPATVLSGVGLLFQMVCTIAAAVLCLVNIVGRPGSAARAQYALALLIAGLVVGVAGFVADHCRQAAGAMGGKETAALLLSVVKYACWGFGLLWIVPVGLTDLLVQGGLAPEAAPAPALTDPDGDLMRLEKLKHMLNGGLITRAEYKAKKQQIVSDL